MALRDAPGYTPHSSHTHLNWKRETRAGEACAGGGADTSRSLGKAIRARRCEIGLNQADLATRVSRLGLAMRQSDVSRLERDQVTLPRHSRLAHIAAALDLTLGELLARAGWDGAAQEFQDGPSGLLPVATEPPTAREAHGLDGGVAAERRLLARVRATQARVQDLHRQLLDDRSRNPGSLAEASVRR